MEESYINFLAINQKVSCLLFLYQIPGDRVARKVLWHKVRNLDEVLETHPGQAGDVSGSLADFTIWRHWVTRVALLGSGQGHSLGAGIPCCHTVLPDQDCYMKSHFQTSF
jgi:hypothetical protein